MFNYIIGAVCGGIIVGSISGVRKLARIRRLKKELKYIKDRNDVCSKENEILISKISDVRDENKALQQTMQMWEPLSFRIATEYPDERDQSMHIPQMGIELINYLRNRLEKRDQQIECARKVMMQIMDSNKLPKAMAKEWMEEIKEFAPEPKSSEK